MFDGVFLHHFLQENIEDLKHQRINRILFLDKSSFVFLLSNKKQLYISLGESAHLRFSELEFIASSRQNPFSSILKKYGEGAIIENASQYKNDRVLVLLVNSAGDLGYIQKTKLIFEFFGRNANLIVTDEQDIIIDCYKKSYVLNDSNQRILVPKARYEFPSTDRMNPFLSNQEILEKERYMGLSLLVYTEIRFQNNLNIIKAKTDPVLISSNQKTYFYCFPLSHLNGETKHFPTLSALMETYYQKVRSENIENSEQKQIEAYLRKEKAKAIHKLSKQEEEMKIAKENLNLEEIGNLLSANLYKIKKGDSSISVENFYKNYEQTVILLDSWKTPAENLQAVFKQYKKSKRAVTIIGEQIEATKAEIEYFNTLEDQLQLSKASEIKEILQELHITKPQNVKRKTKPQITSFSDRYGNIIMVGKNNIQNEYLTHSIAKKNDYFFHVQGAPGSHTVLRSASLTEDAILIAAMIAAYYSKKRFSANVAVDYTLVKYVKKVPKTRGSFVTYTNYKTVFVTPDYDIIQKRTTAITSSYK